MNNIYKAGLVGLLTLSALNMNVAMAAEVSFDCVLSNTPDGNLMTTFGKTTPEIFLVCKSDNVVKGDEISAEWIAVDTNNAAPANYKIADKTVEVDRDLAEGETYTAKLSLSKPNDGWPVGSYDVKLLLGGKVNQVIHFSVK